MFSIIKRLTFAAALLILSGCCIEDPTDKVLLAAGVAGAGTALYLLAPKRSVSRIETPGICWGKWSVTEYRTSRTGWLPIA